MFDLMYANPSSDVFDSQKLFAFLRKKDSELLLIVVNFSGESLSAQVTIPAHAFDFFHIEEGTHEATELLSGEKRTDLWRKDGQIGVEVKGYNGIIIKQILS